MNFMTQTHRIKRCFASAGLIAALMLSTGCGLTEVVVVVDGPDMVVRNATSLQMQVLDSGGGTVFDETQSVSALGTNAFPVTLSLSPGGAEDAGFTVLVRMTDAMGEIRSARTATFVSGKSLRLDIPLFPACRGVMCSVGQTCTSSGGCGSAVVDSAMLEDWTGNP